MDKRFNAVSLQQQMGWRRQAVADVLEHPEWSLAQAVGHIRKTLRLTHAELAALSGVSFRTLQEIEAERSDGTVQTLNKILGVLGLRLGVVSGRG
jgi:DNA-binding XRE family transcriptional regulator